MLITCFQDIDHSFSATILSIRVSRPLQLTSLLVVSSSPRIESYDDTGRSFCLHRQWSPLGSSYASLAGGWSSCVGLETEERNEAHTHTALCAVGTGSGRAWKTLARQGKDVRISPHVNDGLSSFSMHTHEDGCSADTRDVQASERGTASKRFEEDSAAPKH